MASKIKSVIKNPWKLAIYFAHRGFLDKWSDERYLKTLFRAKFGYKLDLDNPKTFSEKLQWIKLHDHNQDYQKMVDKYDVKGYVSSIIGNEYVIPAYGVWDHFEDISFDELPEQFVLKCTHDSGGIVICHDKSKLDLNEAKRKINTSMNSNYYLQGREWPYKGMKHRIIAEQLLVDESGDELRDYKVMCFCGVPKLIEFHTGRYTDHQSQDFYDTEWKKTTISQGGLQQFQTTNYVAPRPSTLDKMLELSSVLSKDIAHVRIDWYSVYGKLYFGEITFFDGSGLDPFDDPNDDLILGSWIDLSLVKTRKG